MLTETLLSAVVEAVFGYVLDQSGLAEKIRASLGRNLQQLTFKIALSRTYTAFARNYPQWTVSLFDEHFLAHRAAPFLACCLTRDAAPDPAGLAAAWADQLGLEGQRRQQRIAELTPVCATFLDWLDAELRARPEFQPLFDSRALDAIAGATAETAHAVEELQGELTHALDEAAKYKAVIEQAQGLAIGDHATATVTNVYNSYFSGTFTSLDDYYVPPDALASPRVSQSEHVQVSLLPILKPAAVATLNEIQPVTLRVTVEQTASVERSLYDQTRRIKLHARDTALLAVEAPDGSVVDLTDYLAAWVTPRHIEIERLLRQAAEHHPDRQFVGYQGSSTLAQGADIVRAQARAIFTALKEDVDLTYINSPLNLGKQQGQITQRVRLPSESLTAGGSANCIDGTVLFASLLELASIDPFIVIVPGHAFLGWRIWRGIDRYEFLETTMISSADFAAAQQTAQDQYDEALMKGYFSRGLFGPGSFARLVDVALCHAREIYPLE